MARSVEETLEGPTKEIYESVKQRIQIHTFCEHPFSLKQNTVAEWWREAAELLKNKQPNAKIKTTATSSIRKSVSSSFC